MAAPEDDPTLRAVVDAVTALAWALFADDDATYLTGEYAPSDTEIELARMLVASLRLRGYDVTPLSTPAADDHGGRPNVAAPDIQPGGRTRNVPTPEFVLDLLSSDGQRRPGDENLTGLADALRILDRDLQQTVAAALYTYAVERLLVAAEAEERAKLIPPDEFRDRNLVTAERIARLWREATHAR